MLCPSLQNVAAGRWHQPAWPSRRAQKVSLQLALSVRTLWYRGSTRAAPLLLNDHLGRMLQRRRQ